MPEKIEVLMLPDAGLNVSTVQVRVQNEFTDRRAEQITLPVIQIAVRLLRLLPAL